MSADDYVTCPKCKSILLKKIEKEVEVLKRRCADYYGKIDSEKYIKTWTQYQEKEKQVEDIKSGNFKYLNTLGINHDYKFKDEITEDSNLIIESCFFGHCNVCGYNFEKKNKYAEKI